MGLCSSLRRALRYGRVIFEHLAHPMNTDIVSIGSNSLKPGKSLLLQHLICDSGKKLGTEDVEAA